MIQLRVLYGNTVVGTNTRDTIFLAHYSASWESDLSLVKILYTSPARGWLVSSNLPSPFLDE